MNAERSIEKDCVRLFGQYFSIQPMKFKEKDGVKIDGKTNKGQETKNAGYEIYDTPTQYFLYNKTEAATFSSLSNDDKQVVDKIMKESGFDKIEIFNMDHIVEFRRLFWQFPEIVEKMDRVSKQYDDSSYIVLFNLYLSEMVKYNVYTDEVLASLREFRSYIANKGVEFEGEISSDLKSDLYYFLEFDRFEKDDYIKQKADGVLNMVCRAIEDSDCPDVRTFRSIRDREAVPMTIVSEFEKLILLNYVWNPDPIVIEETRAAVEKMDLDILKEYLNFQPKEWQKYALIYESRENLAVNSRRCVAVNSKIRMNDGQFKEAGELEIGDRLLASDKKGYVSVTRLEKRVDMTYKVRLETGEELELTANHRLPTQVNFSKGEFGLCEDDYKFVSDIKVGDFIPTILGYQSNGKQFTIEKSKLLGYLIGDGALAGFGVSITKYDKNYVEVLKELIIKSGFTYTYKEEENILYIQGMLDLLRKTGLYRSKSSTKKIPEQMFGECDENKWAIVEGLLNTDGYLQIKGGKVCKDGYRRKKQTVIEYCSISEELIKGLHILLNDLGIINYYNKKLKKIRLKTFESDDYEAYYLYVSDIDSLKKVFNNCDLKFKKNFEEANKIIFSQKEYINSNIGTLPLYSFKDKKYKGSKDKINGVRYPRYNYQRHKAYAYGTEEWLEYQRSKVVSIEPLYEQEVVDIETNGNSLYWIDSVLSHNSGKTRLVVYIAIRQLFLPRQMILYIIPTKENYSEQPFAYIEALLDSVRKKGAELPGFSFNSKDMRVTNSITGSKILFLSGQGSSKGKSFSSNLNIIDEAAFIDDKNLYDQVFNSTADTRGRTWAISTINVDTPINWFFFKKVVLDGSKDAKVHNVNLYDNPFIPEEDKAKIERDFKDRNPEVWLSDWMAIFVGGTEGFDTSKFFKINFLYDVVQFKGQKFNIHRNLESYEKFILFYDPAKTQDKAGVVLLGKVGSNAEVIMSGYIHVKNYYTQREILLEIINYLKEIKPLDFGIDLGKAGEAAFDWFENQKVSPYGILSTGGNTVTKNTYRRWNVPAATMESNLNGLISSGVVTGYSWLEEIKNEFDTYSLAKQRKGAVGHHNDVLSALMNAAFIWYERGMIKISENNQPKIENKPLVDAYGRPIRSVKQGQFDGNLLSKFLY